ncbi:AN1-type zinc finger protein 5-like [Grus japonensis]|uniref:AN1-type zinc finger protein 5-like n=1 Tax=Grus japonensis TaxID=30415 RepID=A0ABC9WDK4_GRUJA
MKKTMARQAVPLQPMEDDGGADIHLQPVEDPTLEQVEAPDGGCDPVGSPRWSRLMAGPEALWREEPTPKQIQPTVEINEFSELTGLLPLLSVDRKWVGIRPIIETG